MSDTMSKSGLQVFEPRSGMSGQTSDMSALAGQYTEQTPWSLGWAKVSIWTEDTLKLKAFDSTSLQSFSGSSAMNVDPLHPPAKFASDDDADNEFVYASLCDSMLTLTYIQYKKGTLEPAVTGVWLGTSSGGQFPPPVKA